MNSEKDVGKITEFFKGLKQLEGSPEGIHSTMEKAVAKECSKIFLKYWMAGSTKEETGNEKEKSEKEKSLEKFLSAGKVEEYEDHDMEALFEDSFFTKLVRESEVIQAKNVSLQTILDMIEKSIRVKAKKAGIDGLWETIISSQNSLMPNLKRALEEIKRELIPDLKFFVGIR